MNKFEAAFIQCLKDGVYPGPSNINKRRDRGRFNKLNGQDTKHRLELMYLFAIPYQRGNYIYDGTLARDAGSVPEYPYCFMEDTSPKPTQGSRKHEIMNPDEPWKLRRK